MISVIIPAYNEEAYISTCLEALLMQKTDRAFEVIVAANACTDKTQELTLGFQAAFSEKSRQLTLLDIETPGKPNALNRADAISTGANRIYLDADVIISPNLIDEIGAVLEENQPVYASGRLKLALAKSWTTRAYGRIWARLPFMTNGVPGAGLFAVNATARARWQQFPEIISDDTFVRLNFTPNERILVNAPYEWPLVEGISALVRVRRRQNRGVQEVQNLFPELLENQGDPQLSLGEAAKLCLSDPLGFLVYSGVSLATKLPIGAKNAWSRGR